MNHAPPTNTGILHEPLSRLLWESRYRLAGAGGPAEPSIEASWERVALALAEPESNHRDDWRRRFLDALAHFRFLPGGRILANAGSHTQQTLLNCFACGRLHDSIGGIFGALAESMVTLQAGGGLGCDFSPLRPHGMPAAGGTVAASGPVSFLHVWDHACTVMASPRERQAAMMAVLRCDHPDIERFIDARGAANSLRRFRLAVLVSDAFLDAVERGEPWPLVFPLGDATPAPGAAVCERALPGDEGTTTCLVHRSVDARALWDRIVGAAFDTGEPGVLFIDRIARQNNLYYREQLAASGPDGEAPLPPHGACPLGAINLGAFVQDPYGPHARLDLPAVDATAALATRMLDNVYDITPFPLQAQKQAALAARRLGLGITGLADALAMLGLDYGSAPARDLATAAMRTVCHSAYRASVLLARERGSFPAFDAARFLQAPFIQALPDDLRAQIGRDGLRNSQLTAVAPAASISLLANNASCGIEPLGPLHGHREEPGQGRIAVRSRAYAVFRERLGERAAPPPALARAGQAGVAEQFDMMVALQPWVDQAIANAVHLRPDFSLEDCRPLFGDAWRQGLKGCAMYRADAPP